MCDVCDRKARSSARLAAYFRQTARETGIQAYIDIMTQAAESLAELSVYFGSGCRCNDRPEELTAAPGVSLTPLTDQFIDSVANSTRSFR